MRTLKYLIIKAFQFRHAILTGAPTIVESPLFRKMIILSLCMSGLFIYPPDGFTTAIR